MLKEILRARTVMGSLLAATIVVITAGCASGAGGPGPLPGGADVDAAVRPYCDAVARMQAVPDAAPTGVAAAAAAARRQTADAAAVAPPEIAGDWQALREDTDQAMGAIAAAGDDPNRVDRAALARLEQQSQPAVARIRTVTSERCGITFRPPA